MARSNKPILWLPFAGGGLVAALIVPVLILITGVLMPLGILCHMRRWRRSRTTRSAS